VRYYALITLFLSLGSNLVYANPEHTLLTGPQIWQQVFVPAVQEKFRRDNHGLSKVETILKNLGGTIVLDHGGTRTADPQVYAFLTRIANAFGLQISNQYKFPSKCLQAIDLQLQGPQSFKWFSTLIKYDDLSPEVAKLIELDNQSSRPHLSERGVLLLEKLEEKKALTREEAQELVHEIVFKYCKRHGRPLSKETLLTISKESPETANSLLLGPDFSHIAISINDLNIPHWYGLEVIEVLRQKLEAASFTFLPTIQGEKGSKLRQTSIIADNGNFPILLEGGITSSISYPSKYVEFIQRGAELDHKGKIQFSGDKVTLFNGFMRDNAEKIYSATDPKPQTRSDARQ
jgi:hypothetical protein